MTIKQEVLVSIGIPFYDSGKYLEFAIKSVLNQSYTNWELILIDDGSKDNSLEIANKFCNDPRITVSSDGCNKGLPHRLNELSNLANGKYYARMDADDIMLPNRIIDQVSFLEKNTSVDLVGGGAISIDANNKIIGIRTVREKRDYSKEEIINKGCFVHPSVMGKTTWFVNNKYDVLYKRSQDLELWIRTAEFSVFRNLEKPLIFYREVGIPTFSKYYKSILAVYKINKTYLGNSIVFSSKLLAKLVIYGMFSMFRMTDLLVRKRSKKIEDEISYDELLKKSII